MQNPSFESTGVCASFEMLPGAIACWPASLEVSKSVLLLTGHPVELIQKEKQAEKTICGWEWDIPFNFHTTCCSSLMMKDISLLIFEKFTWWWFRLHSPVKLRHEGCVRYSGITTKNKEKTELITKCKLIILRDVSSSLRISTLSRLANPKNMWSYISASEAS